MERLNIFDLFERMEEIVEESRDWDLLESSFLDLCRQLAGEKAANRAERVPFSRYQQQLEQSYNRALEQARLSQGVAIYYEYELDELWGGTFFICSEYDRHYSDEWASQIMADVDGPELVEAGEMFDDYGFDDDLAAIGVTCYLIAQTVAALGRCTTKVPPSVPVAIGFHDQSPLLHLT